jgi:TetR/AcrR family transcriptional regulator, regulator of biofilm formation and stress response
VDEERRERRTVEERRGQLVDAAISLVAEEGLSYATTRRITERAGVALGAFHYAFSSKAELVAAVMDRIGSRTEDALADTPSTVSSLDDAVHAVLAAHAELVASDPDLQLARQELTVRGLRDPDLRGLVVEQQRRIESAVQHCLGAGADTASDDELRALAGYLAATLDGLVLHRLVDPEGAPRREELHATALARLTGETVG